MYTTPDWHSTLPAHALFPEWLGHEGSLTTRLVNTGHPFRLCLDRNITDLPSPDEAHALGILADCPVIAREVHLTLDDVPVIAARTVVRADSSVWLHVIDRGNRALGITLFSRDAPAPRSPLEFAALSPHHPLGRMAGLTQPDEMRWARRSRFEQEGVVLLVQEVFLPPLLRFI